MWLAWGRGEVFTGFWLGGPNVRYHWEGLGICGPVGDRNRWGELDSAGSE
jgi:hypothetical protein